MATVKKTQYDPALQYRVELAERIELYGQTLYPGHHVVLRGDVLAALPPSVVKSAAAQAKDA